MPPTDRIAMLSNQELADKLRQHGVNVGPIVLSTRSLYEKKLRKLESGEVSRPKYEEVPDDEEEEENEEEEDEDDAPAQVSFSRQVPSEARQRVPTKVTPSRVSRNKQAADQRENMTPTSHLSRPKPNRKEESKKGFPVWTLLLIFLILAVFGYMIVKNMEADAESSIPNQIDAQV